MKKKKTHMVIRGEKRARPKGSKGESMWLWGKGKVPVSREASRGDMEGFVGFYSKCDGKL